MKIVIIDDEPKVREGMVRMLGSHPGWQVIRSFPDGESAFDYLREVPSDVIITDIRMPGLSGLDLIKKLKETGNKAAFIVLSGYELFEYAQRAVELGVKKFLVKPTSPTELTKTLEQLEKELDIQSFKDRPSENNKTSNLLVVRAEEYISLHYRSKFTLKDVAEALYVSPNYLSNLFKEHTGKKFSDYLMEIRLEKSIEYLMDIRYTIAQIAELVGFSDYRYYSSTFRKKYGETPVEYRNNHCVK